MKILLGVLLVLSPWCVLSQDAEAVMWSEGGDATIDVTWDAGGQWGASVLHYPGPGNDLDFVDRINFSLSSASDTSGNLWEFYFGPGEGALMIDLADVAQIDLFDEGGNPMMPTLYNWGSWSGVSLDEGAYYLQIAGNITGTQGGVYNINLSKQASHVNIPAAILLLGSGVLGLLGFKKQQQG